MLVVCSPRLFQSQQLPAAQLGPRCATPQELCKSQKLPAAQQHLPAAENSHGDSQGATLRRLFQMQQLPSAHHKAHSAAGTHGATLRRLFQTQQLPSAQQHAPSAEESQGAILRRLFQMQQLPAAQQHAPSAEDTQGATLRRLFQTQQLPAAQPAGSGPLQLQGCLQPSRGSSLQKLGRQLSFRPGAALPAENLGAGRQVLYATGLATAEAPSGGQVGCSAA